MDGHEWMCVCVGVFKRLKLERLVVLVGRGGDIIIVDGMGLPCSWHPSSSMDHAIYHDDGDGDGGFKGSRSVSTPCSGHPEGPVLWAYGRRPPWRTAAGSVRSRTASSWDGGARVRCYHHHHHHHHHHHYHRRRWIQRRSLFLFLFLFLFLLLLLLLSSCCCCCTISSSWRSNLGRSWVRMRMMPGILVDEEDARYPRRSIWATLVDPWRRRRRFCCSLPHLLLLSSTPPSLGRWQAWLHMGNCSDSYSYPCNCNNHSIHSRPHYGNCHSSIPTPPLLRAPPSLSLGRYVATHWWLTTKPIQMEGMDAESLNWERFGWIGLDEADLIN